MPRHPDFARVAFRPAEGDRVFVWDPVPDTLPTLGPEPETLAAAFGKRSLPRIAKVAEILETLRTLGRL